MTGARLARASVQDPIEGGWWRRIPGGFQMYFGDSLHGMYVDFLVRGDGLVGRAFSHSDTCFGRYLAETVSARGVPCPPGGPPLPAEPGG